MESVASKALDVDAVIEENVAVVAPVVEDLANGGGLEVGFEDLDSVLGFSVVVDEETGAVAKIDVRADEAAGADDFSLAYGRLFLGVNADCLCVPGVNSCRVLLQNFHNLICVSLVPNNGRPGHFQPLKGRVFEIFLIAEGEILKFFVGAD